MSDPEIVLFIRRAKSELGAERLAAICGVNKRSVYHWCKGNSPCKHAALGIMAAVSHCTGRPFDLGESVRLAGLAES